MAKSNSISLKIFQGLSALIVLAFLCFGVFFPLGNLFLEFLWMPNTLSFLFESSILGVVQISLVQAVTSVMGACVLGLPLGLVLGSQKELSKWPRFFLLLPYGIPSVVAAMSWVTLLGRGSLLENGDILYSLKAVILAHIFFNAPLVALWISEARSQISLTQLEAARSLGAGFWSRLRWIIGPQIQWTLAVVLVQAFSFCVMSFALVLILGGGPPIQTLETEIYSQIRYGDLNLSSAMAAGIWQLLICLIPWIFILTLRRGKRAFGFYFQVSRLGTSRISWSAVLWGLLASGFILPYLSIFWIPDGFQLPERFIASFLTSMVLSISSSMGVVLVSSAGVWVVRWIKSLELPLTLLMSLPMGISTLVFGLSFWIFYSRWTDPFSGSLSLMIFLQIVIFCPMVFQILWSFSQNLTSSSVDAARSLGAGPLRAFYFVEWPRWKPVIGLCLALVAGGSLGELAAVSLFYSENLVPIPLLISRLASQYRFEEAQTLSAVLLLMSFLLMLSLFWFGKFSFDNKKEAAL